MIDVINEILTNLKTKLNGVTIKNSYDDSKPKFPLVTINETDNIVNTNYISSNICNAFDVTLDINIFDIGSNRKTSVKNIRNKIDEIMLNEYKMNRYSSQEIENYMDNSVYRWVLRYSFTIDNNKKIYRG